MEQTSTTNKIVKNSDWQLAWQIVNETDTSLFLTGKAGTGKTTFLRCLKETTDKRMVILAPTGIAAINARGVTIHSFFQLPFSPFIPGVTSTESHYRFSKEKLKIIRGADLIVIDEISMVRADLLDAVDNALKRFRRNSLPFGGVQLLMIGDLQQLAPVVKDDEWQMMSQYYRSPYFFDSIALGQINYATVELKKVFRQDDNKFIDILNKIREGKADSNTLAELNKRYIPNFSPKPEEGYIRLTTHNAFAQRTNDQELASLPGRTFSYRAEIAGNYPEYSYPTDENLEIKLGAQVMFVKNDTSGNKQYYNGMIGEVCAISANGFCVRSKDDGQHIEAGRETWQNCRYTIDDKTNEIKEEVEGTFSQYPVKLAWAITIHKSQGLTFSHAIIDAHASFAHGQTYVALSRCKSLDGLVLSAPLTPQTIISDNRVESFNKQVEANEPKESDITAMRRRYMINLLNELFNFIPAERALNNMNRVVSEHLYNTYPKTLSEFRVVLKAFHERATLIADRFRQQYEKLVAECQDCKVSDELQQRISKGACYFLKEAALANDVFLRSNLQTGNKQIKKQLDNATEGLHEVMILKIQMLRFAADHPFTVEGYLRAKASVLLGKEADGSSQRSKKKATAKTVIPDGNLHPTLLNELVAWRTEKMREEGLPAYCILAQKPLSGISNTLPADLDALVQIPGIGKGKADKYGVEILAIVKRYVKEHS